MCLFCCFLCSLSLRAAISHPTSVAVGLQLQQLHVCTCGQVMLGMNLPYSYLSIRPDAAQTFYIEAFHIVHGIFQALCLNLQHLTL